MTSVPVSGSPDDDIRKTLGQLERQIAARVRLEQLRNQLTGLPNVFALNEALQGCIERGAPFWAAFVEVDRFKSVNARFGYENADALLIKIAATLQTATDWFSVSIGWLVAADLRTVTEREVFVALERAVGEAKRRRDRVEPYTAALDSKDTFSLRADCPKCETSFALDALRAQNLGKESLWCPNCGTRTERPPAPERANEGRPATV